MAETKIRFHIGDDLPFDQTIKLYESVAWTAYTNEENRTQLLKAIQNSTYVVTAWEGEKLLGLARCLSDNVSIFYLQDILIRPEYQGQGLGKQLMEKCLAPYEHVRMKVLITDNEEKQIGFYEGLGFKNTGEIKDINAFVQAKGLEIK